MSEDCICPVGYYAKRSQVKFQGETTHKSTFKPLPMERHQQVEAPKIIQKKYDPEVLHSNYNQSYVKPQVKYEVPKVNDNLIESYRNKQKELKLSTQTQYKKTFQKYDVKPEKRPEYKYQPSNKKFEGESSYKSSFTEKKNNDVFANTAEMSLKQYQANKAQVKFEGQSSYNDTFKNHDVKPQRQPQFKYQPSNKRFQGESSYKNTFTKPPKESYKSDLSYCPIHPQKVAMK